MAKLASGGIDQTGRRRKPETHQAEFTAGTEQQRALYCRGPGQPKQLAERNQQHGLHRDQARNGVEEPQWLAHHFTEIDLHADREEEDPEQQRLERLHGGFDGFAVFGFRQQQSGDERAERHRQARLIGDHSRADDDEQHRGDEQVARARGDDQPEQRAHQPAAADHDHRDRNRRLQQRGAETGERRCAWSRGEQRDEHQDRDHGEILRQQHRKAGAAHIGGQPLLLRQQLEHDRGGGQRQADAEHQRIRRLVAGERRNPGKRRRGGEHLQPAKPEHQPPHRQQPMKRNFQADQEQQKDDTQLGYSGDVPGVADGEPVERRKRADERTQPERPENRAGAEIADDRAEAQAADDWDHDAGGAEHHQGIAVSGDVYGRRQDASVDTRLVAEGIGAR